MATYFETDHSAAWSIFAEILLREIISCAFGANSIAFVSGITQLLGTKLPTVEKRNLALAILVGQSSVVQTLARGQLLCGPRPP